MKTTLLAAILTLFTITSMAGTATTTITVLEEPSTSDINKAIALLQDAADAKNSGELVVYREKMKRALDYQKKQRKTKAYSAAFIASINNSVVNYFEVLDVDFDELRYEVMVNDTCFTGDVDQANSLLEQMIASDKLNYDEEWFDNSRVNNTNELFVDLVDGPNEYTETLSILRCE